PPGLSYVGSIVTPSSVRCESCQGVTCDPTLFVLCSHRKFLEGGMARKPTDTVQLKLRFSEALRRRLEREAKRNNRSIDTEIIHRLQRTFAIDDSGAATNMLDFLRGLGVGVNERDVAVAFSQVFPRWLPLAPGTGTTQGTTETKPKSEDDR